MRFPPLLPLLLCAALPGCAGSQSPIASVPAISSTSAPTPPDRRPDFLLLEATGKKTEEGLAIVREIDADAPLRKDLQPILDRPFVKWTLQLGVEARRLAQQNCGDAPTECAARFEHPAFFVIMKGGNRPKQGLAIETPTGLRAFARSWYVEVDPRRADLLIPHEYGHAIMFEMLSGDMPDHPSILPHTTSAITNDVVAFTEGWGIHFETLAGDRRETVDIHAHRHRDGFSTNVPYTHGDSMVPAKDLLNYSQSYRRYGCIKENCFAFLPRVPSRYAKSSPTASDVLARWTDATHDPAKLRSLSQMVASEGVVAALFYRLATADMETTERLENGDPALPSTERYSAMLAAFASLSAERLETTPALLAFLEALLESSPLEERKRIVRIALEVLHYTPVFDDAQQYYRQLHHHGHLMNRDEAMTMINERAPLMEAAVERIAANPGQLVAKAVRELWLVNDTIELELAIFGMSKIPLVFDLNTAPVEFLMTIPGVTLDGAEAIRSHRDQRGGFTEVSELKTLPKIPAKAASAAEKMRARFLSERSEQ